MPGQILSASRRTDIPGYYMPWFMKCINREEFTVINPFNQKSRVVTATPDTVHTIVFWSKNFGPFLALNAHRILAEKGFNLFFNFTVNAENPVLEPGIPDLAARLKQAADLSKDLTPLQIAWRFDPICFYDINNRPCTNLEGFKTIARTLSDLGVTRCVTSFYDPYGKVDRRIRRLTRRGGPSIRFTQPQPEKKQAVIRKMARFLASMSMDLCLCCEKSVMQAVADIPNIHPSACIDGRRYRDLFGGTPDTAGDYGQRRKQGCNCTRSIDVGSYQAHPCPHNCLFCYASPQIDSKKAGSKTNSPFCFQQKQGLT